MTKRTGLLVLAMLGVLTLLLWLLLETLNDTSVWLLSA